MKRIKYLITFAIIFYASHTASALDIQYGSILSMKNSNVIIEYYAVEKKSKFLCNISSGACSTTKKSTLGFQPKPTIKKPLKKELDDKKAGYITFSKSGNFLAYYLRATDTNGARTYVIRNLKTNKEYALSSKINYWDLVNEESKVYEFSADSKTLIYKNDQDDAMSLYKVNIAKLSGEDFIGDKLPLSAYSVSSFVFGDDGILYYIGNTKENPYAWSLYGFSMKTNKDKIIESNVSYTNSILKSGSILVFNHLQEKGYGPETYNTKTKKIVNFKIPNIKTVSNTKSNTVVNVGNENAVIMMPPKESVVPRPLVIWLHGGPFRQTSFDYHPYHSYGIYDAMLKLLQKNNVIVMKLDYRGSFGVGRNYSESIKGSVGLGDVSDVMTAVNYARKNYSINNIYLIGNSYGGYLSLKALAEHPNEFTGALSINGVTDWESLLVKMKTSIFNTQFFGLPNENNRALYDQASILNKTSNIGNQKIQIVQGQSDRTIAPWQATLLYDQLKSQGKNVTFTPYDGEDHVFAKKKNISDLCIQLFNFVGVPVDSSCSNS